MRDSLREHERARPAYAEDLRGRPDEINMPMEEVMDPLEEQLLEDPKKKQQKKIC